MSPRAKALTNQGEIEYGNGGTREDTTSFVPRVLRNRTLSP